ncbi:MAG: hypothetical protein WDO14_16345 [Bacteroidota bacterium]
MKSLTAALMVLIAISGANAQSWTPNFSTSYVFTTPTRGMKQYIKYGNGLSMSLLAEAPSHRIAAGLEFNWSGYGHSKTEQDYTFPDGSVAPMNVVVNNSITTLMATTRLYLILKGPVRPYASVKAGYSFFRTKLLILDPDDDDSCKPVESNLLSKDGTLVYSAGGGVRIDGSWIFKKWEKNKYFIDFSSQMTQGGRVNYMNEDAPASATSHMGMSTRVKEVDGQFINTQTQVIHSHHVGYLYNSFVQMMDFRLGMTVNIGY